MNPLLVRINIRSRDESKRFDSIRKEQSRPAWMEIKRNRVRAANSNVAFHRRSTSFFAALSTTTREFHMRTRGLHLGHASSTFKIRSKFRGNHAKADPLPSCVHARRLIRFASEEQTRQPRERDRVRDILLVASSSYSRTKASPYANINANGEIKIIPGLVSLVAMLTTTTPAVR